MSSFLRAGTPPRSPHVDLPPTSFTFPPSLAVPSQDRHHNPTTSPYSPALRRSMAHAMLRPAKRDVVVCLVTLFFAWITLGFKHGSSDDNIYGNSYSMTPAEVDSSKASWYGSHYIAKVSNKFSNFKGLWPGSAKELEQLEDVLCPTLPDGSYGHYNHKGYSDSVRRVSDESTTP
jgi:hypothetical protein